MIGIKKATSFVVLFVFINFALSVIIVEDFQINGDVTATLDSGNEVPLWVYSPTLWYTRYTMNRVAGPTGTSATTTYDANAGKAVVTFTGTPTIDRGQPIYFSPSWVRFSYQYRADLYNNPNVVSPYANMNFTDLFDGTGGGTNTGLFIGFTATSSPLTVHLDFVGYNYAYIRETFTIQADQYFLYELTFSNYPNFDFTKVYNILIEVVTQSQFELNSVYFADAPIPQCAASSNINSASAVEVPVNYNTPVTVDIETCNSCNLGDFTGFNVPYLGDFNVFWYSVPQQAHAYSLSLSSSSFSGFDDAYLYLFSSNGNLLASIDNFQSETFSLSYIVNEQQVFIAFGAYCDLSSYSLTISFSSSVSDCSVAVEDLGDTLIGILGDVQQQNTALAADLQSAQGAIIAEITNAKNSLTTYVTEQVDILEDDILEAIDDNANTVLTGVNDEIDSEFTALTSTLTAAFIEVNGKVDGATDSVVDICGSAVDGVESLQTYLSAQWDDFKTERILEKLVTGALVPPYYQTPQSQGGILEQVYSVVNTKYLAKKALADSQKANPTTCLSGTAGSFCNFFYRLPTGVGSANSAYQSAITAYTNGLSQGRYATAFRSLATAYNALFMGQS